ncbi:hypothetical protein DM794_05890 [Paenarthrobacter ureafaciens]|nr:hypothetical protein [Paenarthrobacter ureafaciens]
MVHGVTSFLASVELVAEGATGGLSTITRTCWMLACFSLSKALWRKPLLGTMRVGRCQRLRAGRHPIVRLCMPGERVAREIGIGWSGGLKQVFQRKFLRWTS